MCHSSCVDSPSGCLVIAVVAILCGAVACGPGIGQAMDAAGGCPDDLPKSCPGPVPSYSADVAPLITKKCVPCHMPGGWRRLGSFRPIKTIQSPGLLPDIENKIYTCMMPPADQPQPTSAERQAILAWIVCGAPDN